MLYIKSILLLLQAGVWKRRICTGTEDLAPAAAVRGTPALCVSVNVFDPWARCRMSDSFLPNRPQVEYKLSLRRIGSLAPLFTICLWGWLQQVSMCKTGKALWSGTLSDKPVPQLASLLLRFQRRVPAAFVTEQEKPFYFHWDLQRESEPVLC